MPSPTFTILANFTNATGGVFEDAAGDLFGTTITGGSFGDGSVFEIAFSSGLYASTPAALASFNSTDGARPMGGLIADPSGNLFGTTTSGGSGGDGTLFEVPLLGGGYASTPTTLVNFSGGNGSNALAGLVADAAGDLFGTTDGGPGGGGTVFEVARAGGGYALTPTILVAFNVADGSEPSSGRLIDSEGNLFGTTDEGGTSGGGTAFEIVNTGSGYASTPTTLINFSTVLGDQPQSGLIEDAAGDLFGTTTLSGMVGDAGVFEILNTTTGYASTPLLLAVVPSGHGSIGPLIADAAGNLFGTTQLGGASQDGTVFELADTGNGYSLGILVTFTGAAANGTTPTGALTADTAGNLFGTAYSTVFELSGTGFQPAPPASAPTVVSLTALPASGDMTTGAVVTLSATMTRPVTVTGGAPYLTLSDGGTATYDAGKSSGSTLVFDYTVGATEVTSALTVNGFDPNGATIQDGSADNASFVRPPASFAGLTVNFASLTSFNFNDGNAAGPYGGLLTDGAGDLFGTTVNGGPAGDGTVFEIANTGSGYAGTPTPLVNFSGGDGHSPTGSLISDAAGDLFGTTVSGGANGKGEVFEVTKTDSGYASTATTLVSFNGGNGLDPYGTLLADADGDLFGTTQQGGSGSGTIFEIPLVSGSYASTPTTLVNFDSTTGGTPPSGLIADAAGDLFGTTASGVNGYGTVFELVRTGGGYATTPTTLVAFTGINQQGQGNGFGPVGALIADAAGDLFGMTSGSEGGLTTGGTVFEIPFTGTGYASTVTTLVSFDGPDGSGPIGSLIVDLAGNLFGTTTAGGLYNDGVVFEVAKTGGVYASTPTVLITLNGTDGQSPLGALLANAAGNLFGTTQYGGANGNGTVFELSASVFQVACYRSGTLIATPAGERNVESLAAGDVVLTASGAARQIIEIARRHIDCRHHIQPRQVWPVRVRAGAFGDALPRRDLFLSPDYAVFVDGVLIPIKHLINRVTIEQIAVDEVGYFHIALADHDVLLAEGLPAESWLDTGERSNFANSDGVVRLFADFPAPSALMWEAQGCAPLVVSGPKLAGVRRMLGSRAVAIGCASPAAA